MPVAAVAVRGITPVEPLPSHRPAAAAVSGTTWDRSRPPRLFRQGGRGRPSRRWRTACSEPVPAGRPGAAGSGSSWSGMGRLCDVADEDAGGRHEPGPVGGCSGSPGVRGGPRRVVCGTPSRLLRLFPPAALLHPLLRLFFSYSGRSRGVAEGKGRSRCGRGRARGYRRAWGRRLTRPFRPIGSARLTADAGGPASGVVRDSERRPTRIFPPPPRGPHHRTPARILVRKAQRMESTSGNLDHRARGAGRGEESSWRCRLTIPQRPR